MLFSFSWSWEFRLRPELGERLKTAPVLPAIFSSIFVWPAGMGCPGPFHTISPPYSTPITPFHSTGLNEPV